MASCLKLRTFEYITPSWYMLFESSNFGWMNNICNSLQLTSLFPFLFCDMRLPDSKNQHGMKKNLSRLFVSRPWCKDRIKEEAWARSSLQNMPILLIVYESKEFGSVKKMCHLTNLKAELSFEKGRANNNIIVRYKDYFNMHF